METKRNLEAILKISDREILISGSETFVTEQSSQYKDLIIDFVNRMSTPMIEEKTTKQLTYEILPTPKGNKKVEDADYLDVSSTPTHLKHENVFVIDSDRIQLICDIPGRSTAQRMINVILIYMWAKLQMNIEEIFFSELRDVCEHYGEFNASNFSRYISAQKKYFLLSGSGKSQKAKLIRPGIKAAEGLIQQLNNSQ
jgi:hypothetical protein